MKVIVTGGTGFFGPGIVSRLREAGHEAVAASRHAAGAAQVDVTSPDSCAALMAAHPGTAAVVHAAALAHVPPGEAAAVRCQAVNVDGARNVGRAAVDAGVRRFVLISSVTVYGDYDLQASVTESTPAVSTSMYGAAKRRAEEILTGFSPPLDLWVLRMSTMYSPDWLFNVRKRVSPPVVGRHLYFTLDPDGRRYTLCSKRNGAEAVLWAVEGRMPQGIYNVSEQHVYSQREILRAVEAVEGKKPHVPVPVALPKMLASAAGTLPVGAVGERARSRYWKFCEHNVYSASKLASCGLTLPPDLLEIGGSRP